MGVLALDGEGPGRRATDPVHQQSSGMKKGGHWDVVSREHKLEGFHACGTYPAMPMDCSICNVAVKDSM